MLASKREAEHSSANSFVKKHEAMAATMGMKPARLEEKYMQFDAEMINNGDHAQEFARELTSGLDKTAYPVK